MPTYNIVISLITLLFAVWNGWTANGTHASAKSQATTSVHTEIEASTPVNAEIEAMAPMTPVPGMNHQGRLSPESAPQMGVQVKLRPKEKKTNGVTHDSDD